MHIGRLRHRIDIQEEVESQSGTGEVTHTWQHFATVWASIEPQKMTEGISAEQLSAEAVLRVRIRYRAGITTDHRVLYCTRGLEIMQVIDPGERHTELELLCREAV